MMNIFRLQLIFTVLALTICFAKAAEVQPNQIYTSNSLIESAATGLAFKIPISWQGVWPQEAAFFLMEAEEANGNIFVFIEQANQQALLQFMSQTIPLDSGVHLVPISKPVIVNGSISADYQLPSRTDIRGKIVARTGKYGVAAAIIALASKGNEEKVWNAALQVVRSLKFTQPQAKAQPVANAGSWQQYMQGRHIVRYFSGSGYHEEQHYWLCSNGVFHTSGNAGGYGGGASGAFVNQGGGRWYAEGSVGAQGELIFQEADGNRYSYTLALHNNKLYLADTQWLRDSNNVCN